MRAWRSTLARGRRGAAGRAAAAALAFALAFLAFGPAALAVHDAALFELDGDATGGAAEGDDWTDVVDGSGALLAKAFIHDGADPPADNTYLHTGDSKDIRDFDDWVRTTTDEAPDKDEIVHAFAAAYRDGDGDLVVFFGLDRFDASGDAQVGFWFAQDAVTISGSEVAGSHEVGDVLVLSDFVNGGSVPEIRVFTWVGSGGSDGPLDEVTAGGDADCSAAPGGDERCAIVNADTVDAPWPFADKSGETDFLPGEFFEGGINLTRLGIDPGCISTFIAETRTSQSTDARLKDVALGSFPLCGIAVDKQGDALSKVGDQARYAITITNTGARTLHRQRITDDVLGDLTDGSDPDVVSSTCGASLAPGRSCAIELSYTVRPGDPDPLINRVDVVYNENADRTGSSLSAADVHATNLFQPSVLVRKGATTARSTGGDRVTYTFRIENTSSADSPALVMDSVTDSLLGDLAGEAPASCDRLEPGEGCEFTATRAVAADDPDPLPNTVTVHYHPDGFPNDIADDDTHEVDLFGPAVVVAKEGDALGKVGDAATYRFTITNASSEGTPDLLLVSIVDDVIGDLGPAAREAGCGRLATGADCAFSVARTVLADDPDPLVNRVDVLYRPEGSARDVTASDVHALELFQPSVTVDKRGPATATAGQPLTYTFTVTNTSSADSPPLALKSVVDAGAGWAGLGDLTEEARAAGCAVLPPGGSCSFAVTITAPASPDPLENAVLVLFHPEGFPNDITAGATHSLRIVQVLPRRLARTGGDLAAVLGLGLVLALAGLGLRSVVAGPRR